MTIDAAWMYDGPRSIPQAFPYQGSKRALAGKILSLFPDDGIDRLIEPFAGSAAISVAARKYGLAPQVEISDINAPLMELWKLIVKDPISLSKSYETMWHEQAIDPQSYFNRVRKEFNETHEPHLLLYLLARCVKAAVRYNRRGEFSQSPDNRRMGARPITMSMRLAEASSLMQGASITAGGYEQSLRSASASSLVYLDPPYQGTSNSPDHRYLLGLAREEFSVELAKAVDRGTSFVVSYDVVTDDNQYGEALPDNLGLTHRHVTVGQSAQATLNGKRAISIESLYISPALVRRLGGVSEIDVRLSPPRVPELALF